MFYTYQLITAYMLLPPKLVPGDKIGLVAPGRRVSAHDIEAAIKLFDTWEIPLVVGPNLHSNKHNYLAGSDVERISDFQEMITRPNIKAIICARGGYGTTRILDRLDLSFLQMNPKWIVGFSDVTALHLRLLQLGVSSIHATMPILFSRPDSKESIESLRLTLMGHPVAISAEPTNWNIFGEATAPTIGGNLSLIVDSIGTSSDPDTNGKILVLEEIDEYTYKIDRMLMHLKRSGKLDKLAGLVIGHMTDVKEPEIPFGETIAEVILNKIADKNIPVAFSFPIGHENPNIAWVHGSTMRLSVTENGAQLFPIEP